MEKIERLVAKLMRKLSEMGFETKIFYMVGKSQNYHHFATEDPHEFFSEYGKSSVSTSSVRITHPSFKKPFDIPIVSTGNIISDVWGESQNFMFSERSVIYMTAGGCYVFHEKGCDFVKPAADPQKIKTLFPVIPVESRVSPISIWGVAMDYENGVLVNLRPLLENGNALLTVTGVSGKGFVFTEGRKDAANTFETYVLGESGPSKFTEFHSSEIRRTTFFPNGTMIKIKENDSTKHGAYVLTFKEGIGGIWKEVPGAASVFEDSDAKYEFDPERKYALTEDGLKIYVAGISRNGKNAERYIATFDDGSEVPKIAFYPCPPGDTDYFRVKAAGNGVHAVFYRDRVPHRGYFTNFTDMHLVKKDHPLNKVSIKGKRGGYFFYNETGTAIFVNATGWKPNESGTEIAEIPGEEGDATAAEFLLPLSYLESMTSKKEDEIVLDPRELYPRFYVGNLGTFLYTPGVLNEKGVDYRVVFEEKRGRIALFKRADDPNLLYLCAKNEIYVSEHGETESSCKIDYPNDERESLPLGKRKPTRYFFALLRKNGDGAGGKLVISAAEKPGRRDLVMTIDAGDLDLTGRERIIDASLTDIGGGIYLVLSYVDSDEKARANIYAVIENTKAKRIGDFPGYYTNFVFRVDPDNGEIGVTAVKDFDYMGKRVTFPLQTGTGPLFKKTEKPVLSSLSDPKTI